MSYADYLKLMNPEHFIVSISAFYFGLTIATNSLIPSFSGLMGMFITSILVVGAFNSYNNLQDSRIDAINKPSRPIPSGKIEKKNALLFSLFLYLLIFLLSFLFIESTNFKILLFLNLLLITLYSFPIFRFKDKFIVGNLSVALQYGFFPIVLAWSIFNPIGTLPIGLLFITTLLALAASSTKDFMDYRGDKMFGVKTFCVEFGPQISAKITLTMFILSYLLLFLAAITNIVDTNYILASVLIVFGFKIGKTLVTYPEDASGKSLKHAIALYSFTLLFMALLSI